MKRNSGQKVAVALSGGVDSGVAAALLVQQGYEVTGVHIKLGGFGEFGDFGNKCCDISSFGRVVSLCGQLKIPLKVLDYSQEFADIVIADFLKEYAAGRTPNPCIICNKEIKIGGLLRWALSQGFDYVATGHYAKNVTLVNSLPSRLDRDVGVERAQPEMVAGTARCAPTIGGSCLFMGSDNTKDQSYFLWTLTTEQLSHLMFPIGDLTKTQVRQIARKLNLPVAEAKESFDVCFIGGQRSEVGSQNGGNRGNGGDVGNYLISHLPPGSIRSGEVLDAKGRVIGTHLGLQLYTIGQRRGFRITAKEYAGKILYVVGKDVALNRLVIGEMRGMGEITVGDCNWFCDPRQMLNLKVRIRHQGGLKAIREIREIGGIWEVTLGESVSGVAPGQSAVFYSGEEVVGGGIIGEFERSQGSLPILRQNCNF